MKIGVIMKLNDMYVLVFLDCIKVPHMEEQRNMLNINLWTETDNNVPDIRIVKGTEAGSTMHSTAELNLQNLLYLLKVYKKTVQWKITVYKNLFAI